MNNVFQKYLINSIVPILRILEVDVEGNLIIKSFQPSYLSAKKWIPNGLKLDKKNHTQLVFTSDFRLDLAYGPRSDFLIYFPIS